MSEHQGSAERAMDELLHGAVDILDDDLQEYERHLSSDDSPFWRRGFVRAAFAFMDALAFSMKLKAVFRHKNLQSTAHEEFSRSRAAAEKEDMSQVTARVFSRLVRGAGFSDTELNLLMEITEDIDDKGRRQVRWG